jgi:hypothetical protein
VWTGNGTATASCRFSMVGTVHKHLQCYTFSIRSSMEKIPSHQTSTPPEASRITHPRRSIQHRSLSSTRRRQIKHSHFNQPSGQSFKSIFTIYLPHVNLPNTTSGQVRCLHITASCFTLFAGRGVDGCRNRYSSRN